MVSPNPIYSLSTGFGLLYYYPKVSEDVLRKVLTV